MLSVDAINAMSVTALKMELRDWGLDLSGRRNGCSSKLPRIPMTLDGSAAMAVTTGDSLLNLYPKLRQ